MVSPIATCAMIGRLPGLLGVGVPGVRAHVCVSGGGGGGVQAQSAEGGSVPEPCVVCFKVIESLMVAASPCTPTCVV